MLPQGVRAGPPGGGGAWMGSLSGGEERGWAPYRRERAAAGASKTGKVSARRGMADLSCGARGPTVPRRGTNPTDAGWSRWRVHPHGAYPVIGVEGGSGGIGGQRGNSRALAGGYRGNGQRVVDGRPACRGKRRLNGGVQRVRPGMAGHTRTGQVGVGAPGWAVGYHHIEPLFYSQP